MTRIYTNVPAMIARANLGKNMSALQTSLQRLSTGFKINSGKDDPAGLIASEMLRSDITGIKMAIRNTERANMMIATADSALNEVTNLLNDIRGLVTEAASTGTMSAEMIYANQLQVDASLDAIDRIAAQTTFMGQKLLDGSLDFNLVGIDRNNLKGLAVNQATFGANKAPQDVTINVREAAEKAALYFNQPALAESIVLQWGGNYGYDMETFEKGASVSDIAAIINKRSDNTGVVAEVGSDALKGLLYVSSLGPDNDMIIQAGLAGLNEGNVEIKYLKGSSEGIQVVYEEPVAKGAPAKILVYLQTEAYEAAFADDIDTTWVMQNGKLVPLRDNNALKFEANIEGAQYNNANIYYVDGSLTDPRFYTTDNPTGTSGMPYAYYSDNGQSSSALFGYVPGAGSTGVNDTGAAFDLLMGEYFSIQSRAVGSTYNDVTVQFVAANPSDAVLGGRSATAIYNEQLDAYGNIVPGGKTLTVYYNNTGSTTLQDVQDALNILNNNTGHGFTINPSIGTKKLSDVALFSAPAGRTYSSNTHNSGGVAGSLFIVLPPDGLMPKSPDVPEQMGVTVKMVGDGLYLAHSSPAWDGYTFEFTQNKSVPGHDVTIVFDSSTNKLSITTQGQATYDDILAELNGTWAGKPLGLDDLFWSDAVGNPLTPNVPRTLASTTDSGVVGKSLAAVTSISGQELYLKHDDPLLNDWTIEFVSISAPGTVLTVGGDNAARKITVTYNENVTYNEILAKLNNTVWDSGTNPAPGKFSWIHNDGSPFVGSTDQAISGPVDIGIHLGHDHRAWDGYNIIFDNTGTSGVDITVTDKTITVSYENTVSTYGDIIAVLDGAWTGKPAGAPTGSIYWVDGAGTPITPIGVITSVANVPLNNTVSSGTDILAGSVLRTINTGMYDAKTAIPVGDGFYLAHDNPDLDALTLNFSKTGTTGGSVTVTYSGSTFNIVMDDDATYDTMIAALNQAAFDAGLVLQPDPSLPAFDGFWWVNSAGSSVTPGVPTSLVVSTASGTYRPFAYSSDGRSTLIADGLYLQHSDKSWDNLDIKFTPTADTLAPPLAVNFDGKTVNVIINSTSVPAVTYDDILAALNDPSTWTDPLGNPLVISTPKAGDLRWVDANGMTTSVVDVVPGETNVGTGIDLDLVHSDPKWDGYTIKFAYDPGSGSPLGVSLTGTKELTITYDSTDPSQTYQAMLDALNGVWSGKPPGMGPLSWEVYGLDNPMDQISNTLDGTSILLDNVTYTTKTVAPSISLNHVVSSGAVWREITANDIVAIFDLDNPMSRGSERAASLFTVTTTIDNDGTGLIRLYDYWIDADGNVVDPSKVDPTKHTQVYVKTAFEKAFGGGVTGGAVVTTAAELVTALNNSAFWGQIMCPEMIAELAAENVLGKYYDAGGLAPVITASLAPGNNGYFAVSTFEEVAYYGNPTDGTALQFLGGFNSPNIRFVVDGQNSDLYLDRTSVPAVEGQAQAVLTAQDSGASLTITANKKGGEYDDVQFVFKRVSEDVAGILDPDRRDGWVEYDPGTSFAYAQATFTDATTNQPIENTTFYVTATERGDMFNDVDIMMRLNDNHTGPDPVSVTFDPVTGQLRISIDSTRANSVTTNDIIAAINNANVGFKAELSFSESPLNDGTGKFTDIGLSASQYRTVANTGSTGGHKGGTVTVWLADANAGPGAPAGGSGVYKNPTQEDIVRLINNDSVVSRMFTARAYNTVLGSDGKVIDFVKDGPIVSSGGLIEPALITVHLATDAAGNVTTTAADLEKWWNSLDPALIDNISVSIVRPPGAIWDECDDPYGKGILAPTIARGECDEWIINDIVFVGWNDNVEQQNYVARFSTGVMTSQRGIDSSYQLIAKNLGPEWDGFTIEYIQDGTVSGRFADNLVDGSGMNPCDYDPYSGLLRDDCGNLITPDSTTEQGLRLYYNEATKTITVNVNFGVTTANDIQQLINSDPRTRNLFQVVQLGNGTGLIHPDDDTLLTTGGAAPPGELNGAKLLFGSDATDYYLIFKSKEYGSDQFVDVRAYATDGGNTTFSVSDKNGKTVERATGVDVDAVVNGISAVGTGLDVSLNTSALSLNFTFSEFAGTTPGYSTGFTITGGGATFQVGPDVVSRQQITMGIRSINTVMLGGVSGVLNQLRSGMDASLDPVKGDTNKAFRIVEESLLAITSIRGRLGTMQRATLETNINVLNDTLVALTEAESQIRDTDFAEETSNLTRAQILVQANMNTLGIANQIPNYMLSLLGR